MDRSFVVPRSVIENLGLFPFCELVNLHISEMGDITSTGIYRNASDNINTQTILREAIRQEILDNYEVLMNCEPVEVSAEEIIPDLREEVEELKKEIEHLKAENKRLVSDHMDVLKKFAGKIIDKNSKIRSLVKMVKEQ
jgi:predicted RNase H-like nuclease (RuvC/YqgF family)